MTEPPLTTVEGVRANQRRSTRNSSLANNTDMDRLQAMLTFVTVVETEGFASAARKLAVSPSVISRVVTELEELLGVRLLTRTTRFMRLTEAGAAYFEDCRRILGEIEAAELSAAGERTTPRGQLTITAPVLFGKCLSRQSCSTI
jgi:DNA-binding transcriptional LysR family regulator